MALSQMDRRRFLRFMGRGSLALSLSGSLPLLLQACASLGRPGANDSALAPSTADELRLLGGLHHKIVAAWGDPLNARGDKFGFNNDFLAFFPLETPDEGLLCVNHETPHPLFVAGYADPSVSKTKAQVEKEMEATGVSVLHLREHAPGDWRLVPNSGFNRIINGKTVIPFARGQKIAGSAEALGTLGNCAGGSTPWGTYLTCEENYHYFYGESYYRPRGKSVRVTVEMNKGDLSFPFNWFTHYPQPPEHYGWVVEIDPRRGDAKKLPALGRFAHEGATVRGAKDGRVAVYMGDDAENQCFYKFISDRAGSLESGTLYVANLAEGKWLPLSWKAQKALRKKFRSQVEVNIRTREAAHLVGGSRLDRPEDVEVCPRTGAVFLTLTNNIPRGNFYGSILKVEEKRNDPLALEFRSSLFMAGGEQAGFACPDNLVFDRGGNLWVATDISGKLMNKGEYVPFKNNGLFFIPMSGKDAGQPKLVATAPSDAEFTGPAFSPDGRTLFLSVQHPGELTQSLDQCTSHWPDGGHALPRPAVVAISGPTLDRLTGTGARWGSG